MISPWEVPQEEVHFVSSNPWNIPQEGGCSKKRKEKEKKSGCIELISCVSFLQPQILDNISLWPIASGLTAFSPILVEIKRCFDFP
jgi:hypothetical protein